jgi:hypothetical protein
MEHVQGFTGSHWMPPSGKCLRRIAPAAAVVNKAVKLLRVFGPPRLAPYLVISWIVLTKVKYQT